MKEYKANAWYSVKMYHKTVDSRKRLGEWINGINIIEKKTAREKREKV